MALGDGTRFAAGVAKIENKGLSKARAGAIMASAGRKKFGVKKMSNWASMGKRRVSKAESGE